MVNRNIAGKEIIKVKITHHGNNGSKESSRIRTTMEKALASTHSDNHGAFENGMEVGCHGGGTSIRIVD